MARGLILGAGVTGLASGLKTGYPIYEATNVPGGICRSIYADGYHFEVGGGHWIFGDYQIIKTIKNLGKCNLVGYQRKAGVYLNRIIEAPIQTALMRKEEAREGCMKEWLEHKFGTAMCRTFFWPFNNKYTAGYMDDLVPQDVHKSQKHNEKGYNDIFFYPECGLDKLIDNLADGQDIRYNKIARSIDLDRQTVEFQDGEVVEYDHLISTLPLTKTLQMAGIMETFPYTSVYVLNIGAERGPECPPEHWLYFPDKQYKFFRVGFYSNVNSSFAPKNKISIYVERSYSKFDTMNPMLTSYTDQVIEQLTRMRWINSVESLAGHWIEHAYTWKYPGDDDRIKKGILELDAHDVTSIGRYGKWQFQGIAQSIEDGLSVMIGG